MCDDDFDLGVREAECRACDGFAAVDDLGLCETCSQKLERDMIRQRAWDYSATAFGVPPEKLEELRAATIAEYGAAFELLVSERGPRNRPRGRGSRRRRWRESGR